MSASLSVPPGFGRVDLVQLTHVEGRPYLGEGRMADHPEFPNIVFSFRITKELVTQESIQGADGKFNDRVNFYSRRVGLMSFSVTKRRDFVPMPFVGMYYGKISEDELVQAYNFDNPNLFDNGIMWLAFTTFWAGALRDPTNARRGISLTKFSDAYNDRKSATRKLWTDLEYDRFLNDAKTHPAGSYNGHAFQEAPKRPLSVLSERPTTWHIHITLEGESAEDGVVHRRFSYELTKSLGEDVKSEVTLFVRPSVLASDSSPSSAVNGRQTRSETNAKDAQIREELATMRDFRGGAPAALWDMSYADVASLYEDAKYGIRNLRETSDDELKHVDAWRKNDGLENLTHIIENIAATRFPIEEASTSSSKSSPRFLVHKDGDAVASVPIERLTLLQLRLALRIYVAPHPLNAQLKTAQSKIYAQFGFREDNLKKRRERTKLDPGQEDLDSAMVLTMMSRNEV